MGFRGQPFAFDSPAAAVAGMVARLRIDGTARGAERRPLGEVRGRVLAEAILADRDSPAFDYAAMDGYAVRTADLHRAARSGGSITLRVFGEARVGAEPPGLPDADGAPAALRIATGAPVPRGADAVVRREDVDEHASAGSPGGVASITITGSAAADVREGDNIRRRGENARAGEAVLDAGAVLSAAAIGTLAAVGCAAPLVAPRLRVAVVTTGDELVPPEETPAAFEIRNSNAPAVSAVLGAHAWIGVDRTVHVPDEGGRLVGTLREVLGSVDAVVITGGVSMGHRDPVRGAVEAVGADVVFHGLPQRPGKPMLGAVVAGQDGRQVPVFGLPGNPVSAMVTCTRIVIPVLGAIAGATIPAPVRVRLASPDRRPLGLWWHRLVRINHRGDAELLDARGSGDIIAAGRSDGFIEAPPNAFAEDIAPGALFPYSAWPT